MAVLMGRCRAAAADGTGSATQMTSLAAWSKSETLALDSLGLPAVPWATLPGLFAGGGLDVMTDLLLRTAPLSWSAGQAWGETAGTGRARSVLDFCCGSGTIAAAVLLACQHEARGVASAAAPPALRLGLAVHASDCDQVALSAAQRNLDPLRESLETCDCGAVSLTLHASDMWHRVPPELTFDLILSNPPVHLGRLQHDLSVVEALVRHGVPRLRPGGSMLFVTQELIPVRGLLHRLGLPVELTSIAFTDGRFVVWRVRSPLPLPKKRKRNTANDNRRKRLKAKQKRAAGAAVGNES